MAISLLFGVLISTVLTLIVIPLGTLSAGEASCRNIAVSMGLLPGDADSDAKYNVEKPEKTKKEKSSESTRDPKKWIKALGKKKQVESAEKETSEDKIDTNGLLKKEDKNDV